MRDYGGGGGEYPYEEDIVVSYLKRFPQNFVWDCKFLIMFQT